MLSKSKAPPSSPDDIEAQFYEALQQADIDKLMAVWSDDEDIACVHPGGPRVVGHGAVRASFEAVFGNGPVPVRPQQVRRVEHAGCAVHHVLERVELASAEGPQQAWVLASNVYMKTTQGWRLVLHHASPGSSREAQEIVADAPSTLH